MSDRGHRTRKNRPRTRSEATHGTATLSADRSTLTLTVKGKKTMYRVERIEDTHHDVANPAYSLQKVVPVFELVSAAASEAGATAELVSDGEPYHVALEPHGYSCSCGDFTFRRANEKHSCKHVRAAIAVGLLPKIYRDEHG